MPSEADKLPTRGELALIVGAVLPIFLFLGGPIWEHAFRIDRSVYWSYAPIPVLTFLVLLRRRALSFVGYLIGTFMALSVKYVITAGIAYTLWLSSEPPPIPKPWLVSAAASSDAIGSAPSEPRVVELALLGREHELAVSGDRPLVFRSQDRSLHTLRGTGAGGAILFNRPLLPGRVSQPILPPRGRGAIHLSCAVHEGERHGTLIVAD